MHVLPSTPTQSRIQPPLLSARAPVPWKRLSCAVLTAAAVPMILTTHVAAADVSATFQKSCAGCHIGGGNVLGGPTLRLRDLEANGLATVETITNNIYYGNKRMPGFGENCAPRGQCTFGPRLTDTEIEELARYVLEQAKNDWK